MFDMCACTENLKDCLCPTIGEYAAQCAANGVEIRWRLEVPECRKWEQLTLRNYYSLTLLNLIEHSLCSSKYTCPQQYMTNPI